MNRRSPGFLLVSQAGEGSLQYKAAERLSPTTLRSYEDHLKLWVEHLGDKPVNWIKTADVQEYFVWLRTDYEPRRLAEIVGLCPPRRPATSTSVSPRFSPGPAANSISPAR